MKTKSIVISGLFACLISVFSPITIPIGPIPFTLSIFAIFFTSLMLNTKTGIFAITAFILCGLVGLPVFSGMRGGLNMLLSPTGGFILSYISIPIIMSFREILSKKIHFIPYCIITASLSFLALCTCYFLGTLWFAAITKNPLPYCLAVCVTPFIGFDLLKIIIAIFLENLLKKRLKNIDL